MRRAESRVLMGLGWCFAKPDEGNTRLILDGKISELPEVLSPEDLKIELLDGAKKVDESSGDCFYEFEKSVKGCTIIPLLDAKTVNALILKGKKVVVDEILNLLFTSFSLCTVFDSTFKVYSEQAYYRNHSFAGYYLDPSRDYGDLEEYFINSLVKKLKPLVFQPDHTNEGCLRLFKLTVKFLFSKQKENPRRALETFLNFFYKEMITLNSSVDDKLMRTLNFLIWKLINNDKVNIEKVFEIAKVLVYLLGQNSTDSKQLGAEIDSLRKKVALGNALGNFLFFIKFKLGLHCDASLDGALKNLEEFTKLCPEEKVDFSLFDKDEMSVQQKFQLLRCKQFQGKMTVDDLELLLSEDAALNDKIVEFFREYCSNPPHERHKTFLESFAKAGSVPALVGLVEGSKKGLYKGNSPNYPEAIQYCVRMAELDWKRAAQEVLGILGGSMSSENTQKAIESLERIITQNAMTKINADKAEKAATWKIVKPYLEHFKNTLQKYFIFYFFESRDNFTDFMGDCSKKTIKTFCEEIIDPKSAANGASRYVACFILADMLAKNEPLKSGSYYQEAQKQLSGLPNDNNHPDPLRDFIEGKLEKRNNALVSAQAMAVSRVTRVAPSAKDISAAGLSAMALAAQAGRAESMFVKYPPLDSIADTTAGSPPPYSALSGPALFNKQNPSPTAPALDDFNVAPNSTECAMLEVLRKNNIRSTEQLEAILDHFAQSQQTTKESEGCGKRN